jgi:ATP-dependent Lhr-like helicase
LDYQITRLLNYPMQVFDPTDPLAAFHPTVAAWFRREFPTPTRPQALGWPAIARGESTLILAPTGSGKTLTAFLWCLNRLMFDRASSQRRCRAVYVSPLKALAVDVERNLQAPLLGIAQMAADRGDPHVIPTIAVRTGDTPTLERARFQRHPAEILITTPESLYLLLTSNAREALREVDTIIIDEIHALVPTKRGAHLALSIERLAARCAVPPQRIGLSATQRPLDEVARFLGGADGPAAIHRRSTGAKADQRHAARSRHESPDVVEEELEREFTQPGRVSYRPVTIVDAGSRKALTLTIEVPLDQTPPPAASPRRKRFRKGPGNPEKNDASRAAPPSIWSAVHPRLLELIQAHRSTLIFVNSRRLAERLAGALNELAGTVLVRSHHGSLARAQRTEVEELLKTGALRALVATSSLELGIDMGALDLVVQIEAPPSVASGLQRIGRGGHRIDAVSEGVIFPKFRGDLVACAAVARAMHDGTVESTRYPRNPLDIAAQQIVAMTSMDAWRVDDLFATLRRAAPFAELSRSAFEGVLDMLSGRYPSDAFAELRPRITWHRAAGTVEAREGAKRIAIVNGGTIPDRGLFGVFLAGAERSRAGSARVGELDEEMVFESRVGDTFVLGASSWRIEEITHDRVLVTPAPGEPGRMPFWKGDRPGRPLELGLAIGRLTSDLLALSPAAAIERLTREHDLDTAAAEQLLQYLREQLAVANAVPDASTIVIERVRDELGDWRVCLLSPRGGRVHAPWAMAAAANIRDVTGMEVDTLWGDDGFVLRFPDVDRPPPPEWLLPDPDRVQALVTRQLGATALFAGKFRENAARSLLLPKRRPGVRAPLWLQRKRAADLLAVASHYGSFPVLLETYRECLRDYFDMPALVGTIEAVRDRQIRVATVDSERPSPFAASLLFSYVAAFLYDGDAPLAERRAQALSVDQSQLRELIGDAELRELLDVEAMRAVEREAQRLEPAFHARSADAVHDLLLAVGDLSREELASRATTKEVADSVERLADAGRVLRVRIADSPRYIAVEDAARYRDALGVALPSGVPEALLEPVSDPLGDLVMRYARTHAPFVVADLGRRFGLTGDEAETCLVRLTREGRLLQGEFWPGRTRREWTEPGVLRALRRRSLARLRHEVEPVDPSVLGRFMPTWQGVTRRRRGVDALLDVVEQLQGAPLPASALETEVLPARLDPFIPGDLDALTAGGEVAWVGVEQLGERDGRIALYLTRDAARLLPQARLSPKPALDAREQAIVNYLQAHGASFFAPLHEAAGGGYPGTTVDAVWNLVWQGLVTNDTWHALRAFIQPPPARTSARRDVAAVRPRRPVPPTAEGRWSLVQTLRSPDPGAAEWLTSVAQQLLARHGILTREAITSESLSGGFSVIYPVLKAMEEKGRVRRGYFVAGLGATQFALPGALELLRSLRDPSFRTGPSDRSHQTRHGSDEGDSADTPEVIVLAATDPANPYGASLRWPAPPDGGSARPGRGPTRSVGATVVLVNGALVAYLPRGDRQLLTWLPETEPERSKAGLAVARVLIARARSGGDTPRGMLLEEIDGGPPEEHPLAAFLRQAGFIAGALGFQATFPRRTAVESP